MKLVGQSDATTGGVGERRSRSKGEGIEFEDFRPYTYGDDMRHLDPHIYSRLGQQMVRQYNVSERMTVTLLVDLSPSMTFGTPRKVDVALALAAGLAICVLANGDALRTGVLLDERVDWFPTLTGMGRFDELQRWLNEHPTGGAQRLAPALKTASAMLPFGGICVLLSDMWDEQPEESCAVLRMARQDLIVLRVLSCEEVDPGSLVAGQVHFVDVETGGEVDIDLTDSTLAKYHEHLAAWTARLRDMVIGHQGRFVDLTTDTPLSEMFERQLRASNVIR